MPRPKPALMLSVRSVRHRSIAVYPGDNPNPSNATARPTGPRRLVLRPGAFRVAWLSIFCLHIFCGNFVLMFAALHAFMSQPRMFAYAFTVLQIPLQFLQWGTLVCGALAFAHFAVAARMIYRSVRQRQLSFVWLRRRDASKAQDAMTRLGSPPPSSVCVRAPRALLRFVMAPFALARSKYQTYFGVDGLFGLNGPHFETYTTFREAVEILSQLYQAYLLSCVVAGRWINRFAVMVLVLNAFSTPLVDVVCHVRHTDAFTRRLATLVADLVLDFCSSFLVPVSILFQMVSEFDWKTNSLPPEVVYSDAWLASVVADARQLLTSSTLDLLSILVLNLAVVGTLMMIAVGIRRDQSASRVRGIEALESRNRTLSPPLKHAPVTTVASSHRKRHVLRMVLFVVECGFFLSGIFVLAIHVKSQRDLSEVPSCLLHVDAWFVDKFPCAVVRINLQKLPIGAGMSSVLDLLEPLVVTAMVIAHSSDTVVVPQQLNDFSHIRQLKFVNVSSIVWSDGVRIDDEHHPDLGYILFGHTNMTEVPHLLLHDKLPASLREIEWSHSNLTELPSDIGRFWSNRVWIAVSFDHTRLQTLPPSFSDIPIQHLWLVDNEVKSIPGALFTSPSLRGFTVSGNPISELPPLVADVSPVLMRVFAEYTNISSVPSWLENWYNTQGSPRLMSLYGSDACAATAPPPAAQPALSALKDKACASDLETIRGTLNWDYVWLNQRDP